MKTNTPVIITVFGLALLSVLSIAASTTAAPAPAAPAAPAPTGPQDEMRARIVEKLGLSADQQKIIDGLRAKQRTELQALQDNKDLAPDARRDQARAIVENYRGQMRAALTPEQQQKVAEWRGHMMERAGPMARNFNGRGDRHGPPAMQAAAPANPLAVVAMGERIKDRIAEKLQLTDAQRDQMEHISRAYRAQQRDAAKKHLEDLRAVLTPEQQEKVKQMRQQHGRPGGQPPFLSLNDGPGGPDDDLAGEPALPPEGS